MPAQTHLVRTIGLTAELLRGHPGVLESPSTSRTRWASPQAAFERETLGRFYGAVIREVARADPNAFVFIEPRMDWTTFPADAPEPALWRPWSIFGFTDQPRTFLDLASHGRAARVVASFHYYDPPLVAGVPFRGRLSRRIPAWPAFFAEIDALPGPRPGRHALLDRVRLRSELDAAFGPSARGVRHGRARLHGPAVPRGGGPALQRHLLELRFLQPPPPGRPAPGELEQEENMSLLGPDGPQNLDVASRPYPMRSSARPEFVAVRLRVASGGSRAGGRGRGRADIVFVPARTHFERGFEVRATTSQLPAWDSDRGLLYWWPRPGDDRHGLVVSPQGRFDPQAVAALRSGAPAAHADLVVRNALGVGRRTPPSPSTAAA